jgi:hypothetical protein
VSITKPLISADPAALVVTVVLDLAVLPADFVQLLVQSDLPADFAQLLVQSGLPADFIQNLVQSGLPADFIQNLVQLALPADFAQLLVQSDLPADFAQLLVQSDLALDSVLALANLAVFGHQYLFAMDNIQAQLGIILTSHAQFITGTGIKSPS